MLWSTDKTYGDYWSLVSDGKRILALDNRGVLFLIEADPSGFKLIDKLEVSDRPTWAHLAVCGSEALHPRPEGLDGPTGGSSSEGFSMPHVQAGLR